MENRRDLKLILLMVLCTGYFFSFSLFGEQAFKRVSANDEGFLENTTIGSVDVSNLTYDEALGKLHTEQQKWMEEAAIDLQYKEKKIEFNKSSFLFSLEKSVNQAKSGAKNQLLADVEEEMVAAALIDFGIPVENFNRDAFKQEIISYPSMLEKGVHSIKLEDFLKQKTENKLISEVTLPYRDNSEQMELWISQFPTVTIKPHSQFSILDSIDEKGIKTFTSEGLSIVATAVYKAVLPSNFSITERSIGRELPYYAEAGYEAKVDRNKNMDLIIANPNDFEYVLEFKQVDNKLYVSLSGPEYLYQYRVTLSEKETFNPKNILQYDAKLAAGQQKVKTQGQKGFLQKVYRETVDSSGTVITNELLSEDFYPPVHTVVIKSILEPKKTENTPDTGTENNNTTTEGSESKVTETNPSTAPTPTQEGQTENKNTSTTGEEPDYNDVTK